MYAHQGDPNVYKNGLMASVEQRLVALARRLESEADDVAAATMAKGTHLLPAWMQEPPVVNFIFESTRDGIRAELQALRDGTLPERLPDSNLVGARNLARTATPVTALFGAYRISHQVLWERWRALVEEETGISSEEAAELRDTASDFFFEYSGHMSRLSADAYAEERARTLRSSDRALVSAVCAVLDGEPGAAQRIDHPVDGHNIAVLGRGDSLVARLSALAGELDCRLLVVDVLPGPWWAWLGRSRPFADAVMTRLAELDLQSGWSLGIGSDQPGARGFAESHRQAAAAFGATGEDRQCVTFKEIALEDLGSAEPKAARSFVAAELGPLEGDDARSERLRETLAAYFDCGGNARATATRLGIHHQTVGQRLESIEELLGTSVRERRAELETAIRLRHYLERRHSGDDFPERRHMR